MKLIAAIVVVLATSAAPAVAEELVQFGASIEFRAGLPKLRVGDPAADQNALPGAWTDAGYSAAVSSVWDQTGVTTDTGTGQQVPVWGNERRVWSTVSEPNGPYQLPSASASSDGFRNDAKGWAALGTGNMSSSALFHEYGGGAGARVTSVAEWTRGFLLDPFSSFTLSGLGIFGPSELVAGDNYDASRSFASVTLDDSLGRFGAYLGVYLGPQFATTLRDVVSYSVSSEGLMSLTVTNNTSAAMLGFMTASTQVDANIPWAAVAAPVPEPESIAMMLAGLGLVGAMGRRRRPSTGVMATAVAA